MANLKSGEQVLIFDAFFIFLIGLYGLGTGSGPGVSALAALPTPQLAPLPGQIHCAFWDYICSGTKDIVQATAYVGWAIVNGPVIIIYFIEVFITFADIVLSVVFAPQFSSNGIPFVGFFFSFLQLIVIMMVFRDFRGASFL